MGDLDPFKPLVMLFVLSLVFELAAQVCFIAHYSDYATTGVGLPGLKIFAEVRLWGQGERGGLRSGSGWGTGNSWLTRSVCRCSMECPSVS